MAFWKKKCYKQAQTAPLKSKSNAVSYTSLCNSRHFSLQLASKRVAIYIKTHCKIRKNTLQYASKQQQNHRDFRMKNNLFRIIN